MGKRAAAQFAEGNTPLSEAVVSVVKEAMLSPEQVKRVCEFANTAAYLNEFEKSGEVRNVTFEGGPANPSVVLKELNDGSAPAIHQIKTASYQPPTGHYKTAGASDSILAEAFGVSPGMEKAASVDHLARANASEEIADMKVRLDAVRDDLMSKLSHSGVLLDDVKSDLYSAVKQEVLDGTPMGDIAGAWSSYGDLNQIKEASSFIRDRLQADQVFEGDQFAQSLTKTASAGSVPNPAHPVVDRFLVFTKVAFEHRKLERAVEIINEQLEEVNGKLKVSA